MVYLFLSCNFQEQRAADLARAAEAARLASLAAGFQPPNPMALPNMTMAGAAAAGNMQASRHARRLYVGGLPVS